MENKQGSFYVIEGMDGSGKTTLMRNLKDVYPDAVFVREPGGTPFSEEVRRLFKEYEDLNDDTRMNLAMAARMDLIDKVIIPALEAGKRVFSDRWVHSTYAYQGSNDLLRSSIRKQWHNHIVGEVRPDITFFLNISYEEAQRRKAARGETDYLDRLGEEYFEEIHERYCGILGDEDTDIFSGSVSWVESEGVECIYTPQDILEKVVRDIVQLENWGFLYASGVTLAHYERLAELLVKWKRGEADLKDTTLLTLLTERVCQSYYTSSPMRIFSEVQRKVANLYPLIQEGIYFSFGIQEQDSFGPLVVRSNWVYRDEAGEEQTFTVFHA